MIESFSGPVGTSVAGLRLFQTGTTGFESVKLKHCEPACRVDIIDSIAPLASAMIDISDGVSSEIHHICRMSGVGAVINDGMIPLREGSRAAARVLGISPFDCAYSGGEDFELLFTVPEGSVANVPPSCTEIGVITHSGIFVCGRGRGRYWRIGGLIIFGFEEGAGLRRTKNLNLMDSSKGPLSFDEFGN